MTDADRTDADRTDADRTDADLPTAWRDALLGPTGLFRRPGAGAGADFATAVTDPRTAAVLTDALRRLADLLGARSVVDVGAGGGQLLSRWAASDPGPVLLGLEVAPRPPGLSAGVHWADPTREAPAAWTALLRPPVLAVAHEYLDTVPVLVTCGGRQVAPTELGALPGPVADHGPVPAADARWLDRWWPGWTEPGVVAESGLRRDQAWAALTAALPAGVAVAVDYGHTRAHRRPTVTGYRAGRQVPAVTDGSADLTAHVAVDAVAAAAAGSVLRSQRAALRALGVSGALPPVGCADYAARLQAANAAATLLAPGGFGGFWWVATPTGGAALPAPLTAGTGDGDGPGR